MDPGDELTRAERLGQVVVRPDRESDDLVDLISARREHDDVAVGERAYHPADLHTVDHRQPQVQHHYVGIDLARLVNRLLPVTGHRHVEAVAGQIGPHQVGQGSLVVHDQHPVTDAGWFWDRFARWLAHIPSVGDSGYTRGVGATLSDLQQIFMENPPR